MAKVWGNEEEKPERVLGENGVLTDEDLQELQKDAVENQEEFEKYRSEKLKKTFVTKADLVRHKDKLHEIEIDVGEEIFVFKARRMSERERAQLNQLNFAKFGGDWDKLSPEEVQQIADQGYRVMAQMIVEPKLTVDEWKEVADVALLNLLSTQVAKMSTEVNDAILIEEFKKK